MVRDEAFQILSGFKSVTNLINKLRLKKERRRTREREKIERHREKVSQSIVLARFWHKGGLI